MNEENRERICREVLRCFTRGVDFGMSIDKMKVLAISPELDRALIKTPGHTGWLCVGQRTYYPGSVYLWTLRREEGRHSNYREVMEVKRDNPLTKTLLTNLMCEHKCEYTYEGMLELNV